MFYSTCPSSEQGEEPTLRLKSRGGINYSSKMFYSTCPRSEQGEEPTLRLKSRGGINYSSKMFYSTCPRSEQGEEPTLRVDYHKLINYDCKKFIVQDLAYFAAAVSYVRHNFIALVPKFLNNKTFYGCK